MPKTRIRFRDKIAAAIQRQTSRTSTYGYLALPRGINMFKEPTPGRVRLDFLNYEIKDKHHPDRNDEYETAVPGGRWYRRPFKVHKRIGPNNASIICPSTIDHRCPICEQRAKLMEQGHHYTDDAVKNLKPQARNLYIVIPKDAENYEPKPHIWDISHFCFEEKLWNELQENEFSNGDFPELENGKTLRIRFSEESLGKGSTFAETSRIDFEDRDKPYDESILDGLPSLDDLLIIKDYDTINRIFKGEEEETLAHEDVPPKPDVPTDDDDDEQETRHQRSVDVAPKIVRKHILRKEETEPQVKVKPTDVIPSASKEQKCPQGYRFGDDCDEYPECEGCPVWDPCYARWEEIKRAA
jgi:hypothetical protein